MNPRSVGKWAFVAWLAVVAGCEAATFTVNDPTDAADAAPGDGLCATAAGTCSGEAAFREATAVPGSNTIIVPMGTTALLKPLMVGDPLSLDGDLIVTGGGIIDGRADGIDC